MAGSNSPFSSLSALANYVQLGLFDANAGALIDDPADTPLPDVPERPPQAILLGQHDVPYTLLRSQRRSIGFQINAKGLRVTAPRWVSVAEIDAAILSRQRWILKHLQAQRDRAAIPAALPDAIPPWTHGAQLLFLGQTATLVVTYGQATFFDAESGLITLNLPQDASEALCKKHLQSWLMNQARRLFSERLPHFAALLGVTYHSFALSSAGTRWGSCNSQGKIRLNWRLIHFAPHLIDYVIAHELAHLLEMNHSARFWAKVAEIYPNYLLAREELNRVGLKALP